ncbi:MAG: hypothetical protein DCC65_06250 [Planctomycetota bacterium]|nr:MAG: hypothetical protein DCC65_06250 [Planctomycetota bacterium]
MSATRTYLAQMTFSAILAVSPASARADSFGIPRPDPPGTRTRVEFGAFILDVSNINSADQTFTADVGLVLRWHDPRLVTPGGAVKVVNRTDVWNPDLYVLNQRNVTLLLPDVVDVNPDGIILYRQRFSGQFSNRIHVGDFPFDSHRFHVRFVSGRYSMDELEFVNDVFKDRTGVTEKPLVVDWVITSWRAHEEAFTEGMLSFARPSFSVEFTAARRAGFFVMKLLLPLGLVVFMSWVVFWLDPERVDAQVGMAATAILTLIAYRFTFDSLLPPVSYLTRVDHFISGSTALVFLSLLQVVITGTLVSRNRIPDARRLDRWSRAVFPALFALLTWWSFFA